MENNKKEVVYVSAYLGGYPGTERKDEYVLFAKLYAEGFTYVQEGDEACLWVSREQLPELPTDQQEAANLLEAEGYTVLDVEEDRPDLLPTPSKVQQSYKRA